MNSDPADKNSNNPPSSEPQGAPSRSPCPAHHGVSPLAHSLASRPPHPGSRHQPPATSQRAWKLGLLRPALRPGPPTTDAIPASRPLWCQIPSFFDDFATNLEGLVQQSVGCGTAHTDRLQESPQVGQPLPVHPGNLRAPCGSPASRSVQVATDQQTGQKIQIITAVSTSGFRKQQFFLISWD